MDIIYKYPLQVVSTGEFRIILPLEHRLIDFQLQKGQPVVWAAVNPMSRLCERRIRCLFTGRKFEGQLGDHLGTIQDAYGPVLHFFIEPLGLAKF